MRKLSSEEMDQLIRGINVPDGEEENEKDFYENDADDMLDRKYPGESDAE